MYLFFRLEGSKKDVKLVKYLKISIKYRYIERFGLSFKIISMSSPDARRGGQSSWFVSRCNDVEGNRSKKKKKIASKYLCFDKEILFHISAKTKEQAQSGGVDKAA